MCNRATREKKQRERKKAKNAHLVAHPRKLRCTHCGSLSCLDCLIAQRDHILDKNYVPENDPFVVRINEFEATNEVMGDIDWTIAHSCCELKAQADATPCSPPAPTKTTSGQTNGRGFKWGGSFVLPEYGAFIKPTEKYFETLVLAGQKVSGTQADGTPVAVPGTSLSLFILHSVATVLSLSTFTQT